MNTTSIEKPMRRTRKGQNLSSPELVLSVGNQVHLANMPNVQSPAKGTHHLIALVNVGWGNAVYVRGEGASLSWDLGIPMYCLGEDRWVFAFPTNDPPKAFKFLLNDAHWAIGENQSTDGNEFSVYYPQFPPC